MIDEIIAQLRRGECSDRKRHEQPCATCDAVDARIAWVERAGRFEGALAHIARGNISPAIGFAQRVLAGDALLDAHRAEVRS